MRICTKYWLQVVDPCLAVLHMISFCRGATLNWKSGLLTSTGILFLATPSSHALNMVRRLSWKTFLKSAGEPPPSVLFTFNLCLCLKCLLETFALLRILSWLEFDNRYMREDVKNTMMNIRNAIYLILIINCRVTAWHVFLTLSTSFHL